MTSITQIYTCRCGELDGCEHCAWTGELDELVLVEYMPHQHRSSHAAARNSGTYPANGAIRAAVHHECADRIAEDEAEAPDGCVWFEHRGRPVELAEYAEQPPVSIIAVGGTSFDVHWGDEFLGRVEFESIDADGQYEQDDDEIIDHVRKHYDFGGSIELKIEV
jgi:hypothetical protein